MSEEAKERLIDPKDKGKIGQIIFTIIIVLVLVFSITLASLHIFHTNYYETFWVNGQSMYPTLNLNAKKQDGTLIGKGPDSNPDGNYDVDYGFMDTHDYALKNLNRFDIVVCRYSDDSTKWNIKRLIALPGETFKISYASVGSEENGNLYVQNDKGEFELIEQPIDPEIVHGGTYQASQSNPITLGENEFFVMGDNRYGGNSYDSRTLIEPIKLKNILGRVVGLEARCRIVKNENNEYVPVDIKHYFPRYYF